MPGQKRCMSVTRTCNVLGCAISMPDACLKKRSTICSEHLSYTFLLPFQRVSPDAVFSRPMDLCVCMLQELNAARMEEEAIATASSQSGNAVSRLLNLALAAPGLKLIKPYLGPVLDIAEQSLLFALGIVALPLLLLLVPLLGLVGKKVGFSICCKVMYLLLVGLLQDS